MAYAITERARDLADQIQLEPNVVICFPSLGICYGGEVTKVIPRFGALGLTFGMPDLNFGNLTESSEVDEYLSLSGTTPDVSQQLEPDKASATSTQQIVVKLADLNQTITGLISPGIVTDDLLYKFAQIYLGHKESAFPEDYIELFNGNCSNIVAGSGFVDITISHPEDKKRTEIFPKLEKVLATRVNFNSLVVQDLFYQARPDVVGTLQIEYLPGGPSSDSAVVSVVGNIITVSINVSTRARTIKKAIENDDDANQLVTVRIKEGGNANAVQSLLPLTSFVTDTQIDLDDVSQMLLPQAPLFRTYVVIDEEIIEYTGIDLVNKRLTGCVRQSLNSFGVPHDAGTDVATFYKYGDNTEANGNAIDLALWLMMSKGPEFYASNVDVGNFCQISPSENIANAIFFPAVDLVRLYGVVIGDTCDVSGALNGANNFTGRVIESLVINENGSYITVSGPALVTEVLSPAVIKFKSQYNILPDGVGLTPVQVDIAEFKKKKDLFFSSLAYYEFYFKETIDAKKLINEEIFLPSAFFSIPRKGRISLGVTAPPLFDPNSQELTLDTVENPKSLKVSRGVSRNFYNAVVYRYNEDSVEDKNLSGSITLSTNSTNRISEVSNRPFVINARGLRPSGQTALLIERNTARFLSRYEFGAESIDVEVPFRVGWTTEVGDSIIFGDPRLQVSDTTRGDRNFEPRIFEIINKRLNWRTGAISLSLLDTNFNQSVRYGVWSPSTILGVGSTTTSLKLTESYGTQAPSKERDKWLFYIGKQIVVHSYDWSTSYLTRIVSFDPSDDTRLLIEPVASAPLDGWEITLPDYDQIEPTDSRIYKSIHPFWTPQLTVVSGISSTQFTVSALDAAKAFVGGIVRVHNYEYTIDSGVVNRKITDITGTTITVEDLGFTPVSGHFVDLIGFVSDEGAPYVWL